MGFLDVLGKFGNETSWERSRREVVAIVRSAAVEDKPSRHSGFTSSDPVVKFIVRRCHAT